jgi:D-amino-acid dehydrogenase
MFNRSAPLFIKPRLDPALVWWLWDFHRHCNQAWLDRCMDSLCQMGFPSLALFEQIMADESIACDYQRDGWLDVVLSQRALGHAEAEAAALVKHGYQHQVLTGDELRARSPCFGSNVAGAVLHQDSAHCHPGEFTHGLAAACSRRGVDIRTGTAVDGIAVARTGGLGGALLSSGETVEGTEVVIAAGVWSGRFNAQLGLDIPLQAARGYHVQYDGLEHLPFTGCVLNERCVAVTPMNGQLRLAGTLEIQPPGQPWMRNRLDMLTRGASEYLTGLDQGKVVGEWAGYRPCTSDGMPVVGAAPGMRGLYVATGHAMMGMTLGPVTGRALADLILGLTPSIDMSLLQPARYSTGGGSG